MDTGLVGRHSLFANLFLPIIVYYTILVMSSHSFLLLAHYATFAYQDMLYDYLVGKKVKLVTKMNFPLPELPYLKHLEIVQNKAGKEISKDTKKSLYKPSSIAYFFHSFQLLFLVLRSRYSYDVIIAQDSLLAFLSLFLKLFGKTKKIIFYSHGIDKIRFTNSLFNALYRALDTIAAKNVDFNWFLSKKMAVIRKNQGIDESRLFWIPSSIPISSVARKNKVESKKIVFLGTVDKKNGADKLVEMIELVRKKISSVTLDVMGNGSYFEQLKNEIQRHGLEKNINLLGQLKFSQFAPRLTYYGLGIAPYTYSSENLTPLSDSLKMRIYLAAGLPVAITGGFHFSDEIKEQKLGFAVSDNPKSFSEAIIKLLKNQKLNDQTRKRALAYSKKLDLTVFYNKAFSVVFRTL